MSATVEGNWATNAKAKLSCGSLNDFELKSLNIVFAYEYFLAKNPDLIPQSDDSPVIGTTTTLVGLYNKIICGDLLSETEYEWALAEISRLQKVELASHYVYAAGIHTWNDGASATGDIPITGLLTTDVVNVTLHTQTSTELVSKAKASVGQIDVVMSAAAANTTTKLNYSVLRAMPAS